MLNRSAWKFEQVRYGEDGTPLAQTGRGCNPCPGCAKTAILTLEPLLSNREATKSVMEIL